MVYLIIGGSGSGKSAYAERLMERFTGVTQKYYLATMQIFDEEGEKRKKKHKAARRGKGFLTIEQPRDIKKAAEQIKPGSAVLLECMSNLVANEMFPADGVVPGEQVKEKILAEILALREAVSRLVVVTNNVFEDGVPYDEDTLAYIRTLGEINRCLIREADEATEVVVGLPVSLKEGRKEPCGF